MNTNPEETAHFAEFLQPEQMKHVAAQRETQILIVRAKVLRGDIGLNIVHVFAVCFSTICIYHRNIIGNSGKGYTTCGGLANCPGKALVMQGFDNMWNPDESSNEPLHQNHNHVLPCSCSIFADRTLHLYGAEHLGWRKRDLHIHISQKCAISSQNDHSRLSLTPIHNPDHTGLRTYVLTDSRMIER